MVEHAARIGVGAKASLAVILAHARIADAVERKVLDQRLHRAIVDRHPGAIGFGVSRFCDGQFSALRNLQDAAFGCDPLAAYCSVLRQSRKQRNGIHLCVGRPESQWSITAIAEAGLQIIRLSSVCPPSVVRPHIQEGYLLGEYPEMTGPTQKQHYKNASS